MLGYWRNHNDYRDFVIRQLSCVTDKTSLLEYESIISKLYILDLDPLKTIMSPLYSCTGRPSESQPEIFRAFVLANHLGVPPGRLLDKLRHNYILRTVAGFTVETLVGIASYYDFINRLVKLDEKPVLRAKKRKPSKSIGKGEKLPPKHPGIVARLVKRILKKGELFPRRPERVLQKIFAEACVMPSVRLGLVPETVSASGDGTCIKTGASPFGTKPCGCRENGVYNCGCPRKFSDPNATWGWDSHNNQWFYGYAGYFISIYNKALKLDLPLYLRLVQASRHDSISAVVALSEFRALYPGLALETFISDSASDNYATYGLLDEWGINAVIALNPKNNSQAKLPIEVDGNGTPVCPGGNKMANWGSNSNDRGRKKWRCPKACGKSVPGCAGCSTSPYGRTTYTKPEWDLRLFTAIPRGTKLWKENMKSRTAAERVNNRILHDYGIERSRSRGKKRISFFTTIAAFNVHLDAQLRVMKSSGMFDFGALFGLPAAA
jgi:hypothetical protein